MKVFFIYLLYPYHSTDLFSSSFGFLLRCLSFVSFIQERNKDQIIRFKFLSDPSYHLSNHSCEQRRSSCAFLLSRTNSFFSHLLEPRLQTTGIRRFESFYEPISWLDQFSVSDFFFISNRLIRHQSAPRSFRLKKSLS